MKSSFSASGKAAAAYLALTLLFTWPLARGLAHDIPGDFGDPLLNCWVLAWGASHLGAGWWNANIYFPHPLALAYSEHLFPQAIQIAPIYAVTKNPTVGYNLLFVSTFVLSGLGMFLFVHEITGNRAAAFVAGMAFAFGPYRVTSIPHLQVLSSGWMPFALYGFRRFLASHAWAPLVGAAAAWTAQNLSCGYYLLFFSPVVVIYLVWEITTRSLWRDRRLVVPLGLAIIAVCAATAPFMIPYVELRRLGFSPRSLDETMRFSADVYAYFTADPNLRLWGSTVQAWPKPEGALFPGFTIVALAIAGLKAYTTTEIRTPTATEIRTPTATEIRTPTATEIRTPTAVQAFRPASAALTLILGSLAIIAVLLLGWSIRLPGVKITSLSRALVVVALLDVIVVAASRSVRQTVVGWLRTPSGIFTVTTVFAIAMSLGPVIHARGRTIEPTGLYAAFYGFVPGFDGLRVPARFAMIVSLSLAVLAGLGTIRLAARFRERPRLLAAAVSTAIFLESLAVPIPLNQNSTEYRQAGLAPLAGEVSMATLPPVYGFIAQLPDATALIELPLGEPAFDVRYMFYSTSHWKPLVNGYSGGAPADYERLNQTLQDVLTRPDRAWQAVVDAKATHAIVHEGHYANERGPHVSDWLRARGAREIAAFGSDRVFQLPR